ncbi:MAG: hypothetical protein MI756_12575 [Chromatiales bacterium]|nr:hypothetical protein [Chromatiales bacterium]
MIITESLRSYRCIRDQIALIADYCLTGTLTHLLESRANSLAKPHYTHSASNMNQIMSGHIATGEILTSQPQPNNK